MLSGSAGNAQFGNNLAERIKGRVPMNADRTAALVPRYERAFSGDGVFDAREFATRNLTYRARSAVAQVLNFATRRL